MIGLTLRTLVVFTVLFGAMALAGLAQPPRLPAPIQDFVR
jgi:hypothetical protein